MVIQGTQTTKPEMRLSKCKMKLHCLACHLTTGCHQTNNTFRFSLVIAGWSLVQEMKKQNKRVALICSRHLDQSASVRKCPQCTGIEWNIFGDIFSTDNTVAVLSRSFVCQYKHWQPHENFAHSLLLSLELWNSDERLRKLLHDFGNKH